MNNLTWQSIKSFVKRFRWVIFTVITLVLVVIAVNKIKAISKPKIGPAQIGSPQDIKPQDDKKEPEFPSVNAKYITAAPLDLTQIESISKFRSCAGHDYPGYNFEKTLETDRSMKHYVYPISKYQGTLDKVKMLAPFDGTVSAMTLEKDEIGKPDKRPKTGNAITFETPVDKIVRFEFGHLYFVKDFKVGDTVKAGDLIGYAALGEKENDFDIDLFAWIKKDGTEIRAFGSTFDHMTDTVLAEFAKYGLTPDNTKFAKEVRDAKPCNYASGSQIRGRNNDNWAKLNLVKAEPKTVSKTTNSADSSSDSSGSSSIPEASTPTPSNTEENTPAPTLYLPYSTGSNTPNMMTPMGETLYHPKPQNPKGHPGIDYQWGNPSEVPIIIASMDGEVYKLEEDDYWVGTYKVYTKNGNYAVGYTELGSVKSGLKVGDTVKVGDEIGTPQHPSNITDQPNFRMIHWEFGSYSEQWGIGERICPLSYFASSAKSTIDNLWANTSAPELKTNAPNICSGDYV